MKTLKMSDLQNKKLLSDDVGNMASIIAKDIKIRKLGTYISKNVLTILQKNIKDQ